MSKRTFILCLGKEDEAIVVDADIISIIAIRVMEVYLEINNKAEVSIEFLSSLKAFIDKKLKSNNNYYYSIDIDFENDIK
jgi:hypothetical protein